MASTQNKVVKYSIGEENAPKIETSDYENSIFSNQYRKGLTLIERFLKNPHPDSPQIIAFCGDRGDGKTSCMRTVMDIISNHRINEEAHKYLSDNHLSLLLETKFEIPDMIDPSFFDSDKNLLELILGRLYGNIKAYSEANAYYLDRQTYKEVIGIFSKVKTCLYQMHNSSENSYSELSELSMLSCAVELQHHMKNLVRNYLKLMGKDKLVIAIDDVDLCLGDSYKMCEQIQKYLCFEECIILLAVKHEQLEIAVSIGIANNLLGRDGTFISTEECINMAKKYIVKLLPNSIRVQMPKVFDLCERELVIYARGKVRDKYKSVKDGIVRLIFSKTRYLFYNNKGGVSPIVPSNLRELMSLLGLLYGMIEIENQYEQADDLLVNKQDFKQYFYYIWSKNLNTINRHQVMIWVEETHDINLNKSVVGWLVSELKSTLERKYGIDDTAEDTFDSSSVPIKCLIDDITNSENFSYNDSVGDVFFLLNLLELDRLDPEVERMLFFIKSYYSIRMYESYDLSTEFKSPDFLLPEDIENSIYDVDARFIGTSDLQRLIGGSYFTYLPGMLIRLNNGKTYLDRKVIRGSSNGKGYLSELFAECKKAITEYNDLYAKLKEGENFGLLSDKEIAEMQSDIRNKEKLICLTEFFILTIQRSIRKPEVEKFYKENDSFRLQSAPAAYRKFNSNVGYYVFDVLAPFYNLTNPKYCYDRFEEMVPNLYDFAREHEFTLLYQMLGAVSNWADTNLKHREITYEFCVHRLLSDAVIRNGEVLSAIFENARGARNKDKSAGGLKNITRFYEQIASSHKRTHPKKDSNDSYGYEIKFSFLGVLLKFFKENISEAEESSDLRKRFLEIFDNVDEELLKRNGKNEREIKRSQKNRSGSSTELSVSKVDKKSAAYIMSKQTLISQLNKMLGEGEWTASEIWDRLSIFDKSILGLSETELEVYAPKRRGNAKYSVQFLADTILNNPHRLALWTQMYKSWQNWMASMGDTL